MIASARLEREDERDEIGLETRFNVVQGGRGSETKSMIFLHHFLNDMASNESTSIPPPLRTIWGDQIA